MHWGFSLKGFPVTIYNLWKTQTNKKCTHRKGFFFECQEGSGLVKRLSLYHHMKTVTTCSGKKKRKKEEKDIVSWKTWT